MSENSNSKQVTHFLVELRTRLIRSLVVLFILLAVLMYFANDLYTFLAQPLLRFLPQGHLIATQIVSPFFVPFKLAMMAALLLTIPFMLYQLWAFVAPALYGYERKLIWPFLFMSACLFYPLPLLCPPSCITASEFIKNLKRNNGTIHLGFFVFTRGRVSCDAENWVPT